MAKSGGGGWGPSEEPSFGPSGKGPKKKESGKTYTGPKPRAMKSIPKAEQAKENATNARDARKKKFYHDQRVTAEETGDQATTDKIYRKLGRPSHSVDANQVDRGILGGVAETMGLRLPPGAGALAKPALALGSRAVKGIPEAAGMARQGAMKLVGRQGARRVAALPSRGAQKALPAARKALPKPEGPSPKMQHARVKAGSPRSKQSTARNKGTNARASGTNPRAARAQTTIAKGKEAEAVAAKGASRAASKSDAMNKRAAALREKATKKKAG